MIKGFSRIDRVHAESGAVTIVTVAVCLVLMLFLGFAFELSAAVDARASQDNDLATARNATMASTTLLMAKNSDNPGEYIAQTAVDSLRKNGFNGDVEVWFYESASSNLPHGKRAWAWGIQTKSSLKGYFATYALGDFSIPIGAHVCAHAVPYTAGTAWRPASYGNGKYSFKAGSSTPEYEECSLDQLPKEVSQELTDAINQATSKN